MTVLYTGSVIQYFNLIIGKFDAVIVTADGVFDCLFVYFNVCDFRFLVWLNEQGIDFVLTVHFESSLYI